MPKTTDNTKPTIARGKATIEKYPPMKDKIILTIPKIKPATAILTSSFDHNNIALFFLNADYVRIYNFVKQIR